MIVKINQTKTNFNMEWKVESDGKQLSEISTPLERGKVRVDFIYSNKNYQKLYFNPYDTSFGTKMSDRLSFKVFDGNNLVGHIVGRTKKTGKLFGGYAYYEFDYKGEHYYGYEVGLGSKGLFLCIYKDDELVAIIDKTLLVVNFQDQYVAYLCSENFLEVVLLLCVYYDVTAYGDLMEVSLLSIKEKRVNTIQKELIERYDPNFIPRIKAMHGIIE